MKDRQVWRVTQAVTFALAIGATEVLCSSAATAQDNSDFRYMTVMERPRETYDANGVKIGAGLKLFPSLDVSEAYDDNLYATNTATVDDFETTISPRLELASNWSRHSINFGVYGNLHRYADRTTENNDEYGATAGVKLDLAEGATFGVKAGYARLTVDRGNPDEAGRINPEQVDEATGQIGWSKQFSRLLFGVTGNIIHWREVSSLDSSKDRDEYGGYIRAGYVFSPALKVFVQPSYTLRDYVSGRAGFGFNQDSTVIGGAFGVSYDLTGVLYGETLIGYYSVDFSDPTLRKNSGLSIKSDTTWNLTARDTIILGIFRQNDVTSQSGASSSERTGASLQYQHELRRNILLQANAGYYHEKFLQRIPARNDDQIDAGVKATYLINSYFALYAGYNYTRRTSTDVFSEYDENRFSIGVTSQL